MTLTVLFYDPGQNICSRCFSFLCYASLHLLQSGSWSIDSSHFSLLWKRCLHSLITNGIEKKVTFIKTQNISNNKLILQHVKPDSHNSPPAPDPGTEAGPADKLWRAEAASPWAQPIGGRVLYLMFLCSFLVTKWNYNVMTVIIFFIVSVILKYEDFCLRGSLPFAFPLSQSS